MTAHEHVVPSFQVGTRFIADQVHAIACTRPQPLNQAAALSTQRNGRAFTNVMLSMLFKKIYEVAGLHPEHPDASPFRSSQKGRDAIASCLSCEVRFGSKCEILKVRISFPVCPRKQTPPNHARRSFECRHETLKTPCPTTPRNDAQHRSASVIGDSRIAMHLRRHRLCYVLCSSSWHGYRNGELDEAPVEAAKQATPKKSRKAA
jgi:hypothetical protein